MRITVDAARDYFTDITQQQETSVTPETLPEGPEYQYWAKDGVCGVFHAAHWPNVWMAHYGVMTSAWGKTRSPSIDILHAFWAAENPELIIGWTKESNRAALAFARRIGFSVHGEMNLPSGKIIEQSWRPSC